MTIDEAKQNVGKWVMSVDAGNKCIRRVAIAHGPYKLLKITKGGLAILEGREDFRIPTSLLGPVVLFAVWTGYGWLENKASSSTEKTLVFDSPVMAEQLIQSLQQQATADGGQVGLSVIPVVKQPKKHEHADKVRIFTGTL